METVSDHTPDLSGLLSEMELVLEHDQIRSIGTKAGFTSP